MGSATYIGRVGALAVALGVGVAVAVAPGVAAADSATDSSSSTADSSSTDASSAATDSKPEASPASSGDDPGAADVDDPSDLDNEASAAPVVEPNDEATSPTDEDDFVTPADPEPDAADPVDAEPAPEPEPKAPEESNVSDNSPAEVAAESLALTSDTDALAATHSAPRDQSPAIEPGDTIPLARTVAHETATLISSTTAVPQSAPSVVMDAPVAHTAQVGAVGMASTLARWLGLGSFLSSAPASPAAQPLLWGLLAWARREIQRTFFNRTPTTAYDVFDNEQVADANGALTAVTGNLNALDADGDPLTFTVVEAPGDGSVVINRDGTFVYTPSRELAAVGGTDVFVVKTADEGFHLHGPLAFFKQDFGRTTTTTVEVLVESACPNACQVNPVKVIGTIEVGEAPDGVAFNQDGTRAYVANALDNTVSVINTGTGTVAGTIAVGNHPRGVAVNPVANRAYVTNLLDGTVSVINTTNNTVIATIPVGSSAERVAVSPGGTRVYVIGSQTNGSTMSVINATTNTVISTATLNGTGYGLAVHPNGARIFVATQIDWLDVIDVLDNDVTHIDTDAGWLSGIDFNPLGTRVYYASRDEGTVTVRSTNTNAVLATINVGEDPRGLAVSPDGTRIYVVNKEDDTMSVIRASTNTVIATVDVGDSPNEVAISPDGTRAYVTNSFNDSVSVIQLV